MEKSFAKVNPIYIRPKTFDKLMNYCDKHVNVVEKQSKISLKSHEKLLEMKDLTERTRDSIFELTKQTEDMKKQVFKKHHFLLALICMIVVITIMIIAILIIPHNIKLKKLFYKKSINENNLCKSLPIRINEQTKIYLNTWLILILSLISIGFTLHLNRNQNEKLKKLINENFEFKIKIYTEEKKILNKIEAILQK